MWFGTWNVRSGTRTAVARELDLVVVQEVRWDKEDTVRAGDYNFFYGKGKRKSSIGDRIFCSTE
jgi:hypothetical protein